MFLQFLLCVAGAQGQLVRFFHSVGSAGEVEVQLNRVGIAHVSFGEGGRMTPEGS